MNSPETALGEGPRTRLNGRQVFAVLLLPAVWLIDTTIMAPALGPMAEAFPGASSFWINVVFTVPFVTSIIFSALSGKLSRRVDKKVLVVVGLLLYGVAGLIPAFGGDLLTIFFLRLLTGIGLGLALPMPNVYIAEYYADDRREKMLGYANAVAQIANIAVLLTAGYLITLGWRNVFFGFLLVLAIAVVQIVWLPKSTAPATVTGQANIALDLRKGMPVATIVLLAASMTLTYVAFAIGAANISAFVVSYKVGSVATIGIVATAPAVGNILGSVLSGAVRTLLRSWVPLASIVLLAVGFGLYTATNSLWELFLASGIIGIAAGLQTPYLLDLTAQKVGPLQKGLALGIVSGCIHFGVLLFPYIQELIQLIGARDLKSVFVVGAVLSAAAAIVFLATAGIRRPRRTNPSPQIPAKSLSELGE